MSGQEMSRATTSTAVSELERSESVQREQREQGEQACWRANMQTVTAVELLSAHGNTHTLYSQKENPMVPVRIHARAMNTGPAAPVTTSAACSTFLKQRITTAEQLRMRAMVGVWRGGGVADWEVVKYAVVAASVYGGSVWT